MSEHPNVRGAWLSATTVRALGLAVVVTVQLGVAPHASARPSGHPAAAVHASRFLTPNFRPGQALTDIFASVIVIRPTGFSEKKAYVSGIGTYVVLPDSTREDLKFDLTYQYHGSPPSRGRAEIKDDGRTECLDGKCSTSHDASGLVYNPVLWGPAPALLKVGQSWTVDINEPWEFGPAGREVVTVIAIDPSSGMLTLKREGDGDGPLPEDPAQMRVEKDGKSFMVSMVGGHSHWIGQTVFKDGVIFNDEIMTYRTLTLSSPEVGTISAQFHEYTLQSLSPQPAKGGDIPI